VTTKPMVVPRARWPDVAVLLAAGRGQRLRPLTDTKPKCLLPVHTLPIIDYALDAVAAAGISHIDVVVNHFAEHVRTHVNLRYVSRVSISFSEQVRITGTADAVAASRHNVEAHSSSGYMLIAATDYAYPLDYIRRLCEFHQSHKAQMSISMRLITAQHAPSSSVAEITNDGHVTRILEKPSVVPP